MKLERIKLVNFLSHVDTDLDLSKISLLAIVGENGAGKSSLFDALIWCLYGKVTTRGGQSDSIARFGTAETSVTVNWVLNDIKYQLIRILDNKKKSQKLELSVNGQIISERKKTEVESLLNDILKIPADLYCLTNAMQQESSSFLSLKPTDRKAFLSKIFQLDKYKTVQQQAKTTKNKLINGKSNLEGQLKIVNEEITKYIGIIANKPALEESLGEINSKQERVSSFLKCAAEEKIEEKQKKIKEKSSLETSICHHEEKLQELKDARSDLENFESLVLKLQQEELDLQREYDLLNKQVEEILDNNNQSETDINKKINQYNSDINICKQEYSKLQEIIDKANSLNTTAPCPTCYQEVCNEHILKITSIYKDQQSALKDKGQKLVFDKKQLENELGSLREQNQKKLKNVKESKVKAIASLGEKKDELMNINNQRNWASKKVDEKIKTEEVLDGLRLRLQNLVAEEVSPETIQKIQKAEQINKDLNAEKQEIEKQISHIDFLKAKYEELIEQKEFINTQIKELERNIQIYNLIIDACHPQKGIPAKIIENSLAPLEKISNDILNTFPGSTKFNVHFRTLTEDNKETLQLMVRNSHSIDEKYYEQHSGGEKLRIDLALRVALIRMIGSIYGVDNRTLIIDEGFHSLSTDIRSAAFELLARLHGVWFDKIFVITHSNEISDCVPFKLELKKDKDKTIVGYKNF